MTPDQANAEILPLAKLLGIRFTRTDPDRVQAELVVRAEICTRPAVREGAGTTTIESKTNFVAAAPEGSVLLATATPIHRGRRTQVWQTRIETADGKLIALIALTSQTQLVL
jgi:1,4-dihydroxy-2-naphthoyl-CoA hydrolase